MSQNWLFTVISNINLHCLHPAEVGNSYKSYQESNGHPSPRTELGPFVLVIARAYAHNSELKHNIWKANLFKKPFPKKSENCIKLLRFKLIKWFRKIMHVSLYKKNKFKAENKLTRHRTRSESYHKDTLQQQRAWMGKSSHCSSTASREQSSGLPAPTLWHQSTHHASFLIPAIPGSMYNFPTYSMLWSWFFWCILVVLYNLYSKIP